MFLTVCLNPTLQKTVAIAGLEVSCINRTKVHSFDISGKGINVARVLSQLGKSVLHLTHLGGRFARIFKHSARKEGIRLSAVGVPSEIRFCLTLLDSDRKTTTEIIEDGFQVPPGTGNKVFKLFKKLLSKCRVVIISGSKTDGYSDGLFPDMVAAAKASGKPVILDCRGSDLAKSIPYRPDVIKANLHEFIETFFPEINPANRDDDVMRQVEALMRVLALQHEITTVLTDGPRPVRYVKETTVCRVTPPPLSPYNTTGCGDAFCAGFADAFLKSGDIDEAIRLGIECAQKNALLIRPGVIR